MRARDLQDKLQALLPGWHVGLGCEIVRSLYLVLKPPGDIGMTRFVISDRRLWAWRPSPDAPLFPSQQFCGRGWVERLAEHLLTIERSLKEHKTDV